MQLDYNTLYQGKTSTMLYQGRVGGFYTFRLSTTGETVQYSPEALAEITIVASVADTGLSEAQRNAMTPKTGAMLLDSETDSMNTQPTRNFL